MKPQLITLHINGRDHTLAAAPNANLLDTLRDLGYVDVKAGCEKGDCGACAVLLNGEAVNSCMVLTGQADEASIVTATGLGTVTHPHPIQQAFADHGAIQCGYCTPGFVIAAKALLDHNPHPTELEIRDAISGNLCRCTGYGQIVEAIQAAAETMTADHRPQTADGSTDRRPPTADGSNDGHPSAVGRHPSGGAQ